MSFGPKVQLAEGEFNKEHRRYLQLVEDDYHEDVITAQLRVLDPIVDMMNELLLEGIYLHAHTGARPTGQTTKSGALIARSTTVYTANDAGEYSLLGYFAEHWNLYNFYGNKILKIDEEFALADTVGRLAVNLAKSGVILPGAIDARQGLSSDDNERLQKQRRLYGSIPRGKTLLTVSRL